MGLVLLRGTVFSALCLSYDLYISYVTPSFFLILINLFFRGDPKKKKYRQGSDISAMRDANEIFGDVDELLTIRKKGLASSERMERRLEDEFEPTVLSEKYMTGKDDEIRQLDIPERMQVCSLL